MHSTREEYIALAAKGRLWVADDVVLPDEPITGEPGEIVEYTPGAHPKAYKPEREDFPPFPVDITEFMDRCKRSIEDTFHWHETSQGKVPKNIQSGYSIELLQEKDELAIGPVVIRDQISWERVGKRILHLARQHWGVERTVSVVGKDGIPQIASFSGMDLPENVDVIVESTSLLPTTKMARNQIVMEAVKYGMIAPEDGLRAMLMGFGHLEFATKEATLDEEKQRRENRMIEQGMLPEPANFDRHDIHMRTLTAWRKTPGYEAIKDNPVPGYEELTIDDLAEAHQNGHAVLQLQQEMAVLTLGRPTELTESSRADSSPEPKPFTTPSGADAEEELVTTKE
jgi:hypothetical protein